MDKDKERNENEEQPTSSRKGSQRVNSSADLYDDKKKYDERRRANERAADNVSNSESFTSSYSVRSRRSRVDVTEANTNVPKSQGVKREKVPRERVVNPKKKRVRRTGKVQKRGRSVVRRRAMRKAPRRRPRPRKERALSISTVFTRLSSAASASLRDEHLCEFCGHRCCRRRYMNEKRRRIPGKRKTVAETKKYFCAKAMQAGSRSLMLSPLFINTNLPTPKDLEEERTTYCEITPQMIYEAVRKLTTWKQYAQTAAIFQYMKLNFPVNPDEGELLAELDEKLHVACAADIIMKESEDQWCLCCRLQNRYITKNHVTRFWQVYGDTLSPIVKKTENKPSENTEENKSVPQNYLELIFNEKSIV